MKVADFDFFLPESLIAKNPSEKRDDSRLLVLHRNGSIEHRRFHNLPDYLNPSDILLLNNTRVFPARLTGIKPSGGKIEFLLVKEAGHDAWEILSKKDYNGRLVIAEDLSVTIKNGTAYFEHSGNLRELLWRYGDMPLPPYIKRKPEPQDKETYQTVYAAKEGSIAAPTAGIHFTKELLGKIEEKGIKVRYITLHIGIGTFKPIRTEDVTKHKMDPEYFSIDTDIIEEIKSAKASNNKIISVGTTTTRALEGLMSGRYVNKGLHQTAGAKQISGTTDIFIYPGYGFKCIDSLVTNFHLPSSTPLMLTAALCGIEKLKRAYDTAIAGEYRFFSYGDAMLIL